MKNVEKLCEAGYEELIVFSAPDYDSAIIGVTDDFRVVYDYYKMIDHLMKEDGMSREEAIEFIQCNTIQALPYYEDAPVVITMLEDLI